DQLDRQYGLLSVCATALTIDNAWVAFGSSITTAISNGGAPGLLFELLAACFYYGFIAASLAELASSIPSAGGVYHYASVTPGRRWGRPLGFFAGYLNFFAYVCGISSFGYVGGEVIIQMWALFHPEFVIQDWHIFLPTALINIVCCMIVVFCNSWQPAVQRLGSFVVIAGGLVTIIILAASPKQHASSRFVWTDWVNVTGWSSGTAFLTGNTRLAYAIGTPDSVSHLAEELPHPRRDLPRAVAAQMIFGTLASFVFAVALLYAITDLDAVVNFPGSFPLAEAYIQGTTNKGAAFGLLFILLLAIFSGMQGVFMTCGRTYWALARDNATPFSEFFAKVAPQLSCPVPATVLVGVLSIGLAAISLGSKTAFSDLAGSFVILSTISYLIPIAGHLLTRRRSIPRGPFWMGKYGFFVNAMAVLLIIFTNVMFCLPFAMPTSEETMNYSSVIFVGLVVLIGGWWLWHGWGSYPGPKLPHIDEAGRILEDEK
ncbi:amino acid transporter, partial [Stereum hirsutum FP-91666 SS1]|uniref:amino acid transporter n=1 Tax=Stereum hirsutum (strain FP-91666) TaxID=721885 RepID=UPI00044498E2